MPVDFNYAYRIAFSDTPFNDIPDPVVESGVPAPEGFLLLGLGLLGLGATRRRKAA